ncbi:PACE efflux transporter [uncultured Oxalicibacterium sp.]|uniref:PACE efflux transporter n=1 Tax=uncultured Oxalicibacterium sp. TaxID=1168540 RepID=UPI0025E83022|nr:PACE efflux transporter [uncultured Oxalicibacterium sp.]
MIALRPVTRRVIYVISYELVAIVLSTALLTFMSNDDAHNSTPIAITISLLAVIWNYIFNLLFETWEKRRGATSRSIATRVAHATGFEVGLCLFTIPLYMWWYEVSALQAMVMEFFILLFFLAYTYCFTWAFDTIFGLSQQTSSPRNKSCARERVQPSS